MKLLSLLSLCCITLATTASLAKKPKQKPHPYPSQKISAKDQESDDDDDDNQVHHSYNPNPVVLAGVGQIMNGALSIAQNPHSRPNLGHSIAHMIHGIMSIIVEKVANKKIDITDRQALQNCCDEVCSDISQEITEIIIAKCFLIHED
jgi:hypothetical protein